MISEDACGAILVGRGLSGYNTRMRFVGIDYGKKRVGIAISDEEGKFALPHAVWQNDDGLVARIKALCLEKRADGVVIGESRNLDGSPNEILKEIMMLKETLMQEISTPIYLEPEFYTSAQAERIQGKNAMHDASAAALILKSYLERHDRGHTR